MEIVWSIQLLHLYLDGKRFTICTDQNNFKWIPNYTDFTERPARWHLRLFKFDFDVVHRTGKKHQASNALSRLNASGKDERPLDDDLSLYAIDNFDSLAVSVNTVVYDENRAQRVLSSKTSDDKTECAPRTAVEIIRALQKDTFWRAAATNLEQRNCEFTVDQKRLARRQGLYQWRSPNRSTPVALATKRKNVALLASLRTALLAPSVRHSQTNLLFAPYGCRR